MPRNDASADPTRSRRFRLGVALSAVTAAQLVSAFGVQSYTVALLGAGTETDALYAGSTLPQMMLTVLIDPFGFVLVPLLAVRPERDRRAVGWLLFGVAALSSGLMAMFLWICAPLLVPWLAPGFSERAIVLTVELARIQMAGVVGAGCAIVLSSLYQARQQFLWPACAALISTVAAWIVLLLGVRTYGVTLAAWAQVLNQGGPVLLLLAGLGWPPRRGALGSTSIVRELWQKVRPLLVSAAYYRTGFVIDRLLTSLLAPGSVVILDLAWRMHTAVVRIVNQGITTPLVPSLATLADSGSWDLFLRLYRQRRRWIAGLTLGAALCLGAAVLQADSVEPADSDRLLVGALRMRDVQNLLMVLLASSGALAIGSMNHLFMSAFYAQGETSVPARIQMVSYSIGIALKYAGFVIGGLLGIAVAISVSYALEGVLLASALHRRLNRHMGVDSNSPLKWLPFGVGRRPL